MESTLDVVTDVIGNRPGWDWPNVGEGVSTSGPRFVYENQDRRTVYAFERDWSVFYVGRTAHLAKRMIAHRRAGLHLAAEACSLWQFRTDQAAARFEATLVAAYNPSGNTLLRNVTEHERHLWWMLRDQLDNIKNIAACPSCGGLFIHREDWCFRLCEGSIDCACWQTDPWDGPEEADATISRRTLKGVLRLLGYREPSLKNQLDAIASSFPWPVSTRG